MAIKIGCVNANIGTVNTGLDYTRIKEAHGSGAHVNHAHGSGATTFTFTAQAFLMSWRGNTAAVSRMEITRGGTLMCVISNANHSTQPIHRLFVEDDTGPQDWVISIVQGNQVTTLDEYDEIVEVTQNISITSAEVSIPPNYGTVP